MSEPEVIIKQKVKVETDTRVIETACDDPHHDPEIDYWIAETQRYPAGKQPPTRAMHRCAPCAAAKWQRWLTAEGREMRVRRIFRIGTLQ